MTPLLEADAEDDNDLDDEPDADELRAVEDATLLCDEAEDGFTKLELLIAVPDDIRECVALELLC